MWWWREKGSTGEVEWVVVVGSGGKEVGMRVPVCLVAEGREEKACVAMLLHLKRVSVSGQRP